MKTQIDPELRRTCETQASEAMTEFGYGVVE